MTREITIIMIGTGKSKETGGMVTMLLGVTKMRGITLIEDRVTPKIIEGIITGSSDEMGTIRTADQPE